MVADYRLLYALLELAR